MIRELREENEKLKKILVQVAQGGPINLKELGLGDLNELIETMDENSKAMDDLTKPWEEKLKEEKEREREVKEREPAKREDRRVPHLTNLNEDPQLTGKVYYSLVNCNTSTTSLIICEYRSSVRGSQERQPEALDNLRRDRYPAKPRVLRAEGRRVHLFESVLRRPGAAGTGADQRQETVRRPVVRHGRTTSVPLGPYIVRVQHDPSVQIPVAQTENGRDKKSITADDE